MKLARIAVSPDMLVDLCKVGDERRKVVVESGGLPHDAVYIRHGVDENGWLYFVMSSEAFADITIGQAIPVLPPTRFKIAREHDLAIAGEK